MDKKKIENAVRDILEAVGEDPNRPGLQETPRRVANMYEEMFCGLTEDPAQHLKFFEEKSNDEMVIVRDIPFASMCEHHLLPFMGKAHIAYIPSENKIIGLSKIARIVDNFAKRPQVQERLTHDIAVVAEYADNLGVMYGGRLMEFGTVEDVFARRFNPYTEGLINATPSLRRDADTLTEIPGTPIDITNLPPGCVFADRCLKKTERCEIVSPDDVDMGGGHMVKCHLYAEGEQDA